MRALALLIALVAVGLPRVTAADQPTGFDHIVHEGRVSVLGGDTLACATCHAMAATGALVGRPDHRACFGRCHGAPPTRGQPLDPARAPLCATCHPPSLLAGPRPTVAYPPYQLDPDYGLTLDHARHAAAGCTSCHAMPGPAAATARTKPVAPHARCASCHAAKVAPLMTACGACHPAAYGANARPRVMPGSLAVGAAYDHGRHRARAPGAPMLACEQCHVAIATASGVELSAPAMTTCSGTGCHDGATAFATTERCTRCHLGAPTDAATVPRPTARFSHAGHAARTPLGACVTCHALDRTGQAPAPSHAACVGCHAADFGAPTPVTCGACHTSTEPWRKLPADQLPAPRSEFGAALSHRGHQATPCGSCHSLDTDARELRPARGHGTCTGAGCHQAAGGPAPRLDACEACHQRDREAGRDAARTRAPWSVRRRFRHAPHRRDGRADLACVACHDQVVAADTLDAIAAPTKAACAPCHDGGRAFKLTGHGCARCHGR